MYDQLMNSRFNTSTDLQKLRGLSFSTYNVRSLIRKFDDIKLLLLRSELNVLSLCETWLNSSISDEEIAIPGYSTHRLDRGLGNSKLGGGGLIVYTKHGHHYQHMTEWNVGNDDIEITWVKLSLKLTRPTYIANVYRPPNGNVENFLQVLESKYLDIQAEGVADVLIMGDTNINTLKRGDTNAMKYRNMIKRLRLTQLYNAPSRVTNTTKSCIDHILTNHKEFYRNCNAMDPGLSDHQLIFVSRKKAQHKRTIKHIKCRNFRHFDALKFQADVECIDWSSIYECTDVNVCAHLFRLYLIDICDKHAPYRLLKLREFAPPWLNTSYLDAVDSREHWSKKFRKTPTEYHLFKKLEAINFAKTLKVELQKSYFEEKVQNNWGDSKNLWKSIKEFWPNKPKHSNINKINEYTDNKDIADALNDHFASVGPKLAGMIESNCPHSEYMNIYPPIFDLKEVDLKTIAEAIRDLKPSTSCGIDGLTSRLLKQAGPTIIKPLHYIINLSISSGVFPDSWKTGCITPLYKEGDASDPNNYRPISILPCLGKLCERIIHTQLYQYFADNNLLTENQSGFRKGHSTGTCLIDFLGNIYSNIDKGVLCGVLFLDLKKAFYSSRFNSI